MAVSGGAGTGAVDRPGLPVAGHAAEDARARSTAGRGPGLRPCPGFLAQLLALRAGMPSQRLKRRAAPEEGAAAYSSDAARPARRLLRRRLDVLA
ncbi:MAG: hypothetical protein ACOYOJ_01465 [Alsobacter sp.]